MTAFGRIMKTAFVIICERIMRVKNYGEVVINTFAKFWQN
jgi:hypothetical protein